MTEDTLENFEGLRDNANVSFEVLMTGIINLLDRILPHFTSYGNVKLLQGLLIRGVFKVQVVHIRKLQCQRSLKQTYFAQKKHTYECHFGGRLIAWTGFEQERA